MTERKRKFRLSSKQRVALDTMRDLSWDALDVIECQGEKHVIGVMQGRFFALNHPMGFLIEAQLRDSADEAPTCPCAEKFIDYIKSRRSYGFRSSLIRASEQASNIRSTREREHEETGPTVSEKYHNMIRAAARESYSDAKYWHDRTRAEIVNAGDEGISMEYSRTYTGRVRHSTATLKVSRKWYAEVWKRGIAVVEGYFILSAAELSPGVYRVVALKRKDKYESEPHEGTVYRNAEDDAWAFTWSTKDSTLKAKTKSRTSMSEEKMRCRHVDPATGAQCTNRSKGPRFKFMCECHCR